MEIVDVLKRYLESKGCEVDYALNGKKGLKLIKTLSYDVVFMDINMPEILGTDIIKYMKENDIRTKIVVLTGYLGAADHIRTLAEADEYLEKPIDLQVIGDIIDKYTNKGRDKNGWQ